MIDREEKKGTDGIAEENNPVPIIQRVINGTLYTVKVHFRDGATRTAKETMKSILVHEIDMQGGSEGNFN